MAKGQLRSNKEVKKPKKQPQPVAPAGSFLPQNKWKIDDVLGVWPLHGLCGAWGGIAAGIFGAKALGGVGGVSLMAQVLGTLGGIGVAVIGGTVVYGVLKMVIGIRLDPEAEFNGADLSIHNVSATAERETSW